MPRKVTLAPHLSSDSLKSRYRKNTNPLEARRWHLLWKISQGWTLKNSAVAVGISYGYAKKIVKNYNSQGEKGVITKPKRNHLRGSPPLLNEFQLEKLKAALKERPIDGGIWTGAKVARWIESETGVEKVWNQRGWEYLKKCKSSWQRPRPKHYKGEPIEQKQWKDNFSSKVKAVKEKYPHELLTGLVRPWPRQSAVGLRTPDERANYEQLRLWASIFLPLEYSDLPPQQPKQSFGGGGLAKRIEVAFPRVRVLRAGDAGFERVIVAIPTSRSREGGLR